MKDIEQILENLETPDVTLPTHEGNLKKLVLTSFTNGSIKKQVKGGEYMEFLKQHISKRTVIAAFVVLFAFSFIMRFGMQNTQKAQAQELVQNALKKVPLLPVSAQQGERERLEKAKNASDLHVESSTQNGQSARRTVLKFTNDNGQEETIELEDDEVVISSPMPSVSPVPSTGVFVTPAISGVRSSIGKEREELKESASAEEHENEKSETKEESETSKRVDN